MYLHENIVVQAYHSVCNLIKQITLQLFTAGTILVFETLCNVTCEKVSSPLVDYFIVHSVSVQVYQLVDTIIFLYITVHMYSIIYL